VRHLRDARTAVHRSRYRLDDTAADVVLRMLGRWRHGRRAVPGRSGGGYAKVSHWEHGYRCHGLWDDERPHVRVAAVDLGPRYGWNGIYRWSIDSTGERGEARTLRTAKRQAEQCLTAQATPSSTDA
jgi:hypothetical protein